MNKDEILESLDILLTCVSTISSEDEKYTVIDDIKPSSFDFIIKSVIGYIEDDERGVIE